MTLTEPFGIAANWCAKIGSWVKKTGTFIMTVIGVFTRAAFFAVAFWCIFWLLTQYSFPVLGKRLVELTLGELCVAVFVAVLAASTAMCLWAWAFRDGEKSYHAWGKAALYLCCILGGIYFVSGRP